MSTNSRLKRKIEKRWDSLTKPPGSLGQLEDMVVRYGTIRGEDMPSIQRKAVYVFCADHGVVAEGVSAYPQEVTRQMMANFLRGGAAINVLCRRFSIEPQIVDSGIVGPRVEGARNCKIAEGTRNFCQKPAMTRKQAERAIETGRALAREAAGRFDIAGLGEMGIGNTTSAAALFSAFSGIHPSETAGRGAGIDKNLLGRKAEVIRKALARHQPDPEDPIGVLAAVGGFEIGAIAGFTLGAAEAGLPVVVDGFIASSAVLVARKIEPDSTGVVFYSHRSAERGHARMLGFLDATTYYSLDMCLGEGTGAALTINLLETAVALYREMATFGEAGVSKKE